MNACYAILSIENSEQIYFSQQQQKKKQKKNHYDRIYMVQDNHRWSMISIILLPYL